MTAPAAVVIALVTEEVETEPGEVVKVMVAEMKRVEVKVGVVTAPGAVAIALLVEVRVVEMKLAEEKLGVETSSLMVSEVLVQVCSVGVMASVSMALEELE